MNDINQDLRRASYVQDQERVVNDYNTVIDTISTVRKIVIMTLLTMLLSLMLYKSVGLPELIVGFILFMVTLSAVGYLIAFQHKLNKVKINLEMRTANAPHSIVLNNKFLVSMDSKAENIECLNIITNKSLFISDLKDNNINIEKLLSEIEDFKSSNSPYFKDKYVNIDSLANYIEILSLRQKLS